MRQQLKDFAKNRKWVYGLRVGDVQYTISLLEELETEREQLLSQKAEKVRRESPDLADDILDDTYYYSRIGTLYLWEFALWRIQGLLEGFISGKLLPTSGKTQSGLSRKLDAAEKAGFETTDVERTNLLQWAELRNALMHAPPEMHRPGPLTKEDIYEYRDLVVPIIARWSKQIGLED